MATQSNVSLNDVDEQILEEIRENGRATAGLLDKTIDKTRVYISQRIKRLREHDILIEVAPNLYDLGERQAEYEDRGIELEE